MIRIIDKQDCCGCHACASVCARHSITMQEDNEGFLYPKVDTSTCTDCGLCEKVCPVINQSEPHKPLKVYAAKNNNEEIRLQSSSGGIFTLLAEKVIDEGGVVFGAKFDKDWNVIHSCADTKDGIAAFRGSKYVQSTIGNTYTEAREFLKQGRKVLFSGTPCQIAGLKKFLRKEYDNLLTVDVVCHGVPSPKVWSMYLSEICSKVQKASHTAKKNITSKNDIIQTINFRYKNPSWNNYSICITYKQGIPQYCMNANKDPYMQAFLKDITLRPSCYSCYAKGGTSHSDIKICDFWGVEKVMPECDVEKGVCGIIIYTKKGIETFSFKEVTQKVVLLDDITRFNPSYYKSCVIPDCRIGFFRQLGKDATIIKLINRYTRTSKICRLKNVIQRCFTSIKRWTRKTK